MARYEATLRLRRRTGKHVERRERADGLGYSETYTQLHEDVECLVGMEIDVAGLMDLLASRAINTKRGRSTALGGLIKVQAKAKGK